MTYQIDRRRLLALGAASGVSVQLLARQALAASPVPRRLVVVICRGGMDGLSVTPPIGDAAYQGLRRGLAITEAALPLDGDFGLHPALASVHEMMRAGHGRIAPAIATPDRARSHFEAQDVLESGASGVYGASSGWLNRAVSALSAQGQVAALSVGPTAPLLLRGSAPTTAWSPGRVIDTQARLPILLQDLYKDDPLLGPALARGLEGEALAQTAMSVSGGARPAGVRQGTAAARQTGVTLGGLMTAERGPQIAALSLDGFDTHANQGAAQGQLAGRLAILDNALAGLHEGLGDQWESTVVLVATEFGRTAQANGTGGTDHGTASSALLLGGAIKPGGIIGDWPGLREAALYEGRDLAPSLDMRGLFKGVLADHLGLDRGTLDATVFPDSGDVRPVTALV